MDDSLIVNEWIEATKSFHLRKEEIMSMKKGEVENFLLLDRNACDSYDMNPRGLAQLPRVFLKIVQS
jgi:hypothetical protein